jgi:protein gp37
MGVITHYNIHPLAEYLPDMTEEEFKGLKNDISGIGQLEPIVLFEGKILDGRHRYRACCELGIEPQVYEKNINGMSAMDAVRALNIHRRHLTVSQRAMIATAFLEHAEREAKERQKRKPADSVKVILPEQNRQASDEVAEQFQVSGKTVRDAKVVVTEGTKEEKEKVKSGKASVSSTAKQIRGRSSKSVFNKSDIEWTDFTWNPVTGCHHGCHYCYARGIASRFPDIFPQGFDYHVREERFDAPDNQPAPRPGKNKVFVCSMADLFGDWVEEEVITRVLKKVTTHPEWTFIFLTKNPSRLESYTFPKNAWVGATIDREGSLDGSVISLEKVDASIKYVSFEPLIEEFPIDYKWVSGIIDWVIIGCDSSNSTDKFIPSLHHIITMLDSFKAVGVPVFLKPNVAESFPREMPST